MSGSCSFTFFSPFFIPSSIASPFISRAHGGNCLPDQQLRYVARACACVTRVKQRSKAARYNWSRKAAGISQSSSSFQPLPFAASSTIVTSNRAFRVDDKKPHSNKWNTAPPPSVFTKLLLFAILAVLRLLAPCKSTKIFSLAAHSKSSIYR